MSWLFYQECQSKNECVNMNKPRRNQNNWTSSFYCSFQLTELLVNENAMMEIFRRTMQKTHKKLNDY